jgi:hypothetical protein
MSFSLTGGRDQVVRERDLNCQLTEAGRIMAEGLRNCIRKYVRPESKPATSEVGGTMNARLFPLFDKNLYTR